MSGMHQYRKTEYLKVMPIHNSDIEEIFNRVAELLEMEDANPFRVRAYRNAARTIGGLSKSVADMVESGESLSDLPGIGKDLARKTKEIVETGTLSQLEELEKETPAELHDVLKLPGLGPKKVKALYKELNIDSLTTLETAAKDKKIRELDGFGEKTEENILKEVQRDTGDKKQIRLSVAEQISKPLVDYLKKSKGVKDIDIAGSFRRRKETVGDLDILATCKKGSTVMDRFVAYEDVDTVVSKGKTRSSVILDSGLQVDLRVLPQAGYGAALHYFTGSKAHNIAIRKIAQKKNLKINEYGVYKKDKRMAGKTESAIFKQADLPYIEPELREDRGEIQAARKNRLPHLITLDDIVGDLHAHTNATDGKSSLKDMISAAQEHGYEYLAVSDHSKSLSVARGFDEKRLREQLEEIDRLNETMKQNFTVLKSIEVDIREDGSLDLPDSVLKELDITTCSVHAKFNLSKEKQTERILRAMENPYFYIMGHPTGRLINERAPYDVDMERLMAAAKDRNCFMELNAQPERLDLNEIHCKAAKEMGVKIAICTDAHSIHELDNMRFGIGQARRGWLEPEDVLNTRSWEALKKLLKK
jgi:DNA polymerase (family 10)